MKTPQESVQESSELGVDASFARYNISLSILWCSATSLEIDALTRDKHQQGKQNDSVKEEETDACPPEAQGVLWMWRSP